MRNDKTACNLERFHATLSKIDNKSEHHTTSLSLQFQVHWVKSGGTGTDRSVFKGAVHQGNRLILSLNSEAGHILGWKHRGLLYDRIGIWNFSLSFEKYFTCSLPSPVNYHWIQVEKFCMSKWPCNVLFVLSKDQRKYQIISVINNIDIFFYQHVNRCCKKWKKILYYFS